MECVRCGESDALGRAVVRDGALEAVLCAVCAGATLGHVAERPHATAPYAGGRDPRSGADAEGSSDGDHEGPVPRACAICTGPARVWLPKLDCVIERADGSREWEADRTATVLGLCEVHLARVTTLDASRPAAPRPGSVE